jgi:hypothetical protein
MLNVVTGSAIEAETAEVEAAVVEAAVVEAAVVEAAVVEAEPAELVSAQMPAIASLTIPAAVVKIKLNFACPINAERLADEGMASLVKPIPCSRVKATFVNL